MENKNEKLSDQQMKDVTGGVGAVSLGNEIYNAPDTFYSSENTPKYAIDQEIKIKARICGDICYLPCKVVGVSEKATGGTLFFKEFLYTIEILENEYDKNGSLKGKVLHDIYESCLFE